MASDNTHQQYLDDLQELLNMRAPVVDHLRSNMPGESPLEEVQIAVADNIVMLTRLFVGLRELEDLIEGEGEPDNE